MRGFPFRVVTWYRPVLISVPRREYIQGQIWPVAGLLPRLARACRRNAEGAVMVPKEFDRAGTPQGVFGGELRYYRTEAGLSQTDLAARVNVSHDVISKIETGDRAPAEDFPARLDGVPEMDTREALARLWGQLRKGLRHRAYPGWFGRWADIEAEATALRSYEPLLVPGLLQTEDYARAILAARPGGDEDDLDEQVAARMERQTVVERAGGPHLWCVLDEGVLHRPIGGAKVMQAQLERLAERAEHPKTTVQVIPAAVGAHAGLLGAFVLAELNGSSATVYLETSAEGQVTENPSVVAHVGLRFDRLRSEALPRGASRDLIKKVAEEQWT
jgi:transcriptional regulator with XRE-family HTH domain